MERRRVAVFVDFDNVFSGLQDQEPVAAERFATDPERWVSWLAARAIDSAEPVTRAVLMKRCYLNPAAFGRFRRNFVGAGFEVVDCPPLTAQGKTSADIRIVMDMFDALQHATRFDEFVLLSSDADFTPILTRLRQHDRRTTVVAVGFTSAAYRAVCDDLISAAEFSQSGLGVSGEAGPDDDDDLTETLVAAIQELISTAPEPIATATVAGLLYDRVLRARRLTWESAFGGFKGFSERVQPRGYAVSWQGAGWVYDPSRHAPPSSTLAIRRPPSSELEAQAAAIVVEQVAESADPVSSAIVASRLRDRLLNPMDMDYDAFGGFKAFIERLTLPGIRVSWAVPGWFYDPVRHRIPTAAQPVVRRALAEGVSAEAAALIEKIVFESHGPVASAAVATPLHDRFLAPSGLEWEGLGGFKAWVATLPLSGVEVLWDGPGWFFDPIRHERPAVTYERPTFDHADPDLVRLANDLHRFKNVPLLTPETYADAFRWLAAYINTNGYFLTDASKAMRDSYPGRLPREDSNFILKGITYRYQWTRENDPWVIASAFRDNIVHLTADLYLNAHEQELISAWIMGGFEPREAPAAEEQPGASDAVAMFAEQLAAEVAGAEPAAEQGAP